MKTLYPYQENALDYLHSRWEEGWFGAYLFMQMRLGKTPTCARFIHDVDQYPVLVVCPGAIIDTWVEEIKDEMPGCTIRIVDGTPNNKVKMLGTGGHIYIAPYETSRLYKILETVRPKIVFADETYILAKVFSKISRYFWDRIDRPFMVGLCGNPTPEGKGQALVSQFFCIEGQIHTYEQPFAFMEVAATTDKRGNLTVTHQWDRWLLKRMKKHAFCLTRKEAGVGGGKVYSVRNVKMGRRKQYNALLKDREAEYVDKHGRKKKYNPLSWLAHLRQISSGMDPTDSNTAVDNAKQRELVYLLSNEVPGPVVVFCYFKREIDYTVQFLRDKGFSCFKIDGDTPREEQTRNRRAFDKGLFRVAVLQVDTCKMGLNFSVADTFVYLSNSLSGDVRAQSEDRGIHTTKSHDIHIIDIVCADGADRLIAEMVRNKATTAEDILRAAQNGGLNDTKAKTKAHHHPNSNWKISGRSNKE